MKAIALAIAVAATLISTTSNASTVVAGWDMSQFLGAGFLTTDGANLASSLDANYSNLDPTFGAGSESSTYGTAYWDGTNGSSQVTGPEVNPFSGSLLSNLNAPVTAAGLVPFDSSNVLTSEGQSFYNVLSLGITDVFDVVFKADLSSAMPGADWNLSFGGRALQSAQDVGVAFSTDGSNFTSFGTVSLTTTDSPFSVALGSSASNMAWVRLSFSGTSANQALIDNVALSATIVPEPGTAMLLGLGLVGLAGAGRRRVQ